MGNVPIKVTIVFLGQVLGDVIQALRYRGVSADNISAALPPVLSSWALKDQATVGGLPISNVHIIDPFKKLGGGRGCNKFVPVLGGNGTKIAPTGDIFDQPPCQKR